MHGNDHDPVIPFIHISLCPNIAHTGSISIRIAGCFVSVRYATAVSAREKSDRFGYGFIVATWFSRLVAFQSLEWIQRGIPEMNSQPIPPERKLNRKKRASKLAWIRWGFLFALQAFGVWTCRSNVASDPHKKVSLTGRIRNGATVRRGFSYALWCGKRNIFLRFSRRRVAGLSLLRDPHTPIPIPISISNDRQSLPAARAFRSVPFALHIRTSAFASGAESAAPKKIKDRNKNSWPDDHFFGISCNFKARNV